MIDPRPGDHLLVTRRAGLYVHHGIYIGDGEVVHYSGEIGKAAKANAAVRRTTIEEFANGGNARILNYRLCLDADEVVSRAKSKIGQTDYDLSFNNCEHFATWCKTGSPGSQQIKGAGEFVGGIAGACVGVAGTVAVVSELGAVSGLSAAGVTSGLATVGGVIGGGMVTGLGIVAFVPAATIAAGFFLGRNLMHYLRSERAFVDGASTQGVTDAAPSPPGR